MIIARSARAELQSALAVCPRLLFWDRGRWLNLLAPQAVNPLNGNCLDLESFGNLEKLVAPALSLSAQDGRLDVFNELQISPGFSEPLGGESLNLGGYV